MAGRPIQLQFLTSFQYDLIGFDELCFLPATQFDLIRPVSEGTAGSNQLIWSW